MLRILQVALFLGTMWGVAHFCDIPRPPRTEGPQYHRRVVLSEQEKREVECHLTDPVRVRYYSALCSVALGIGILFTLGDLFGAYRTRSEPLREGKIPTVDVP
jgi:hypothetical protein